MIIFFSYSAVWEISMIVLQVYRTQAFGLVLDLICNILISLQDKVKITR